MAKKQPKRFSQVDRMTHRHPNYLPKVAPEPIPSRLVYSFVCPDHGIVSCRVDDGLSHPDPRICTVRVKPNPNIDLQIYCSKPLTKEV